MARMRTINEAAAYMQEHDEHTALTKTALRRMVVTGMIPSVAVGHKYLINLDVLESYLNAGMADPMTTIKSRCDHEK